MIRARIRVQLVLSLFMAAAVGCSRSVPPKEARPPSTPAANTAPAPLPADPTAREARIVEIATAHAVQKGHSPDSIKLGSVKEANGRARVSFQTEPPRPGGHFTVVVDLSSGQVADFIPGR